MRRRTVGPLIRRAGGLLRRAGGLLRRAGGLLRRVGGLLRRAGGLLRRAPGGFSAAPGGLSAAPGASPPRRVLLRRAGCFSAAPGACPAPRACPPRRGASPPRRGACPLGRQQACRYREADFDPCQREARGGAAALATGHPLAKGASKPDIFQTSSAGRGKPAGWQKLTAKERKNHGPCRAEKPVLTATPGSCFFAAPGGFSAAPGGFFAAPGGFFAAPGGFFAAPGGFSATPGGFLRRAGGLVPSDGNRPAATAKADFDPCQREARGGAAALPTGHPLAGGTSEPDLS